MKNALPRMLALLMALLLSLSAGLPALAEEEAAGEPVLVTFDGEAITQTEVQDFLDYLVYYGYAESSDYELAIDYLLQTRIVNAKIIELGLDQFTAEEEEAFRNEALVEWDEMIEEYVAHFLTEDTEEQRAQKREEAVAYYNAYGYTLDYLADTLKQTAASDRMEAMLLENGGAITPEEIRAMFEEEAAYHQSILQDNVYMYEVYQNYYGYDLWYTPEGYRGIIHILLSVDEELQSAYQDAQTAYEESVTDEAPEGDADLKAARDAAFDAVIASKQDVIDDIYARLANGEDFASLIAAYGEDPGMQDPGNLNGGYAVHKDSVIWDPVFIAGAFSDKMQQPGDTSDPVIGSYGIHILHYLRDIPGGYVEMTDEISAQIEEALKTEKLNAAYAQALEDWGKEHEIVRNDDAIAALAQAAQEAAAEE